MCATKVSTKTICIRTMKISKYNPFFLGGGGMLNCSTALRFPSPGHFISHGVPSSLKASFEGE